MKTKLLALALLVTVAAPAFAATNLITNGDFSAGTTGWTINSNAFSTNSSGYHEGAFGREGQLSQVFADIAGKKLVVDFDFGASSGYQYVSFNGAVIAGSQVNGPSDYSHYTFALGTGTGSDTLTFNGRNDPSYNVLTNVVVISQVPEPATWALMIGGFGMIGAAMRRRATTVIA